MTRSLHLLTDSPHKVTNAVSIHPLSLMIDSTAHGHADTVSILRVGSGPLFIVREGCGAVRVVPEILARVGEVCPQRDG